MRGRGALGRSPFVKHRRRNQFKSVLRHQSAKMGLPVFNPEGGREAFRPTITGVCGGAEAPPQGQYIFYEDHSSSLRAIIETIIAAGGLGCIIG